MWKVVKRSSTANVMFDSATVPGQHAMAHAASFSSYSILDWKQRKLFTETEQNRQTTEQNRRDRRAWEAFYRCTLVLRRREERTAASQRPHAEHVAWIWGTRRTVAWRRGNVQHFVYSLEPPLRKKKESFIILALYSLWMLRVVCCTHLRLLCAVDHAATFAVNAALVASQWSTVRRVVTRVAIHQAPSHYCDAKLRLERRMAVGGTKKSQQCHKYFFQYRTFASERPQFRTRGRQTCFLPRAPSNLVTLLTVREASSLAPIYLRGARGWTVHSTVFGSSVWPEQVLTLPASVAHALPH